MRRLRDDLMDTVRRNDEDGEATTLQDFLTDHGPFYGEERVTYEVMTMFAEGLLRWSPAGYEDVGGAWVGRDDDDSPATRALAARFLNYAFRDIDYDYDLLTPEEKKLCSAEEFQSLERWIREELETTRQN